MTKETIAIPNCFYRVSVKALILDDQKDFCLRLKITAYGNFQVADWILEKNQWKDLLEK